MIPLVGRNENFSVDIEISFFLTSKIISRLFWLVDVNKNKSLLMDKDSLVSFAVTLLTVRLIGIYLKVIDA